MLTFYFQIQQIKHVRDIQKKRHLRPVKLQMTTYLKKVVQYLTINASKIDERIDSNQLLQLNKLFKAEVISRFFPEKKPNKNIIGKPAKKQRKQIRIKPVRIETAAEIRDYYDDIDKFFDDF